MYILAYLIDCKINVVIPAIWVDNLNAEQCFNHGINRNKIYKIFFSRLYQLADFEAPLRTVFSSEENATYRAKICRMIFSKEEAQVKAVRRRQIQPFTCSDSDSPPEESGPNDPSKLVSERALLTPMNVTQVKMEHELVQMQNQLGSMLRNIPLIEMDDILEEVFTIDVDDVDDRGHAYDERFAQLFGLDQLLHDEIKEEPQEEPVIETNQRIEITQRQSSETGLIGVASTSAAAIVRGTMPSSNESRVTPRQLSEAVFVGLASTKAVATARFIITSSDASPLPCNSIKPTPTDDKILPAMDSSNYLTHDHQDDWFIDLTRDDCTMGGAVYDERFARYFGQLEDELQTAEIKEEVADGLYGGFEAFDGDNELERSPESKSPIDDEQKHSPPSSTVVPAMENQAEPSVNTEQQPVQDPISHHHQFVVDILENRHYPLWNVTIPFGVVNTLMSYNTSPGHQDVFHDRLFVQVLVLGSLDALSGRPNNGNVIQAAHSLLSLRVNGDVNRMGHFNRHLQSLRKILESKLAKK